MKKLILTLLAVLAVAATVQAVPAKRGLKRTYAQPDGTTITVTLNGDEWNHSLVTADGLTVARDSAGTVRYRTPEGLSAVVAHNPGERSSDERAFVSQNAGNLTLGALQRAAGKRGPRRAPARKAASQVPQTGSPRIPVILVNYTDVKFKDADPKATFEEHFNTKSNSCLAYFKDQSNGKFTPQFDIYGPYTLSKARRSYGGNDWSGNDRGVGEMVGEACQGMNGSIDFKRYDNDGDGTCDVVIVLYAGVGEASSSVDDAVWPCQWSLAESDYGRNLSLAGVTISKFAVFNELDGTNTSKIDGIGTFCHEFSHCLDLPDFYDNTYSGNYGMGDWSLLDNGCYLDNGDTPCGYTAYEKHFMGWMDLSTPQPGTRYSIAATTDTLHGQAYQVMNDADPNEYYILENRRQVGWDRYLPAQGLMVTHVTYDATAWANNTVNDYSYRNNMERMTIIPADGSKAMQRSGGYYYVVKSDEAGDLYPYNGNDSLTNNSTPAAEVYTGSLMSKPITQITLEAGGNVSFTYMPGSRLNGDVNGDGQVDTRDITALVNYILGTDTTWTHFDIDGDGQVNTGDITALVGITLGN